MRHSESIASIAKALSAAQGEMKAAVKDKKNPYFNSTYADLASVIDAIRVPFAKNGLSFAQGTEASDKNEVRVITLLMHITGEWLESMLAMPVKKDDAQGYGIAMTYARRYSLQAMVGQAAEDDDGNTASGNKQEPQTRTSEEKPLKTEVKTEPIDLKPPQEAPSDGGLPWYDGIFKGGSVGDINKRPAMPHRVAIETVKGAHEFSFFGRPDALKQHDDWAALFNQKCQFRANQMKKGEKLYNNLLDIRFPDMPQIPAQIDEADIPG